MVALAAAPFLLDHPKVGDMFAADAIKRARELVNAFNGGIGAYQVGKMGVRGLLQRLVPSGGTHVWLQPSLMKIYRG